MAACIALPNTLSKPLLWLACQHHMGEVILGHDWDVLKIEIFQRFRKNFSTIETNCKNLNFCVTPPNLTDKKDQIIEKCHSYFKQPLSRGDYKELVKLTLLHLGEPATKKKLQHSTDLEACIKQIGCLKFYMQSKLTCLGPKYRTT